MGNRSDELMRNGKTVLYAFEEAIGQSMSTGKLVAFITNSLIFRIYVWDQCTGQRWHQRLVSDRGSSRVLAIAELDFN